MTTVQSIRQENRTRVNKAFVVVDINNSTRMKQTEAEESWVTKTLSLYTVAYDVISSSDGAIVKFVGDGAMAVFDEDNAVSAINAAIQIQETLKERRKERVSEVTVSIGIAYGSALEFDIDGDQDYLGSTVDRAHRLCSAANANAIFIDSSIIDAAPMTKVKSVVGHALDRGPDQYRGDAQLVELKGFSAAVNYYEIWWDSDRYGIDPDFVSKGTSTSKKDISTDREKSTNLDNSTERPRWLEGYVSRAGDKYGFISSGSKEYFYVPSFIFSVDAQVGNGTKVTFQPFPPSQAGKNEQAKSIFVVGTLVRGSISKLISERGFGFVHITGNERAVHSLFVLFHGEILENVKEGDVIECTIESGSRGPVGINPVRLDGREIEGIQVPDLDDI